MRNLWFIILLLSTALTARAQSYQARIVDLDGNGVAGVEIIGRAGCGGLMAPAKNTFTDADGRFNWPNPGLPPLAPRGCSLTTIYTWELIKEGYSFTRRLFRYNGGDFQLLPLGDDRIPLIHATTLPTVPNVSAASFESLGIVTNEMIVALFGADLAPTAAVAEGSLPTTLAGRKVLVKDVNGVQKAAKLYFVSPTQINYLMPEGLAYGAAQVRVVDEGDNLIKLGLVEIRTIAPGIFTANFDGKGVPSGLIVRVKPGNVQNYEPIAQFDPQQQKFVPVEIDLGPEEEFLVLALFGTGWRQVTFLAIVNVTMTGSIACPVEYVGKQPTFEGVDQVNVRLPRTLIGKGEVFVFIRFGGGSYLNQTQLKLKFK